MTGRDEADRLLEVITVDCYNPSEQMTAFYEVFAEQVPLPTTATVVGATVRVVGIDIAEHGQELTARCQHGEVVQDLQLADLVFPSQCRSRLDSGGVPPLSWPESASNSHASRMEAILAVT